MDRILIIDDDVELCELVREFLAADGFEVDAVHDGLAGAERVLAGDYALAVLDVMLPGLSGFDVLRRIRGDGGPAGRVPVLMLTARGEEVDRIVGLEIGADDYLPKPFNPRELVARIRAILRRSQTTVGDAEATRQRLVVADVEMDTGARSVQRGGAPVDLTAVEFDLLRMLLGQAGSVVPREEIAQTVLGRKLMAFDRSIDMHVSNLRKKLGPRTDQGERIVTVRSVGYVYTLPAA